MTAPYLRTLHLIPFLILSAMLTLPLQAQEKQRYAGVEEALAATDSLSGSGGPDNIIWIDGGNRYSYMLYNPETETMEIRAYDPSSGEDEGIFNPGEHTFPGDTAAFEFRSFQWSDDSRFILFQSNFRPVYRRSGVADYYLYAVGAGTLQLLVEDAMTAELSPDGQKVGYERAGDLWVYDLNSSAERQLTDSAKESFYNGRFGWVYEEEFGLAQAWSWSPDSRHIAYWQIDEREVPLFRMTDYADQHPQYFTLPYPKVGDRNPAVRIGVVDVENGEQTWMNAPEQKMEYIPRIYWTSRRGQLALVHLNRPQNHMQLTFHDIHTGEGRLVMEERSEKWIDLFDFFAGISHLFFFPDDREEFFWISDRDGWSHIYRYSYDGELVNRVTEGEWEVTYVHTIDRETGRIYYTSTEVSPLERHLHSVGIDGSDRRQHTQSQGAHDVTMGENGRYYIDRWSGTSTPLQVELWQSDGTLLEKLEDNEAVTRFTERHVYAPRELFRFTTGDGQQLDGYMIRPPDFDSTETYPLLLNIYGGPGAQGVYNIFETGGWTQYLAQKGYVIVNVNNRGSGGYGSAFEKIVYRQLARWEARDFAETARHMAEKPWIDGSRMAIRGHSYGGYMSAYVMLTEPGLFAAGIAGAPVTDWRLYDTIYTERYMGLLQENPEGYRESAPVTHAANLEGELLIAHATMDENVHVQHTMQLLTALAANGRDAALRIYPPGAHGVSFNEASYHLLYRTYTEFLDRHLGMNKP